MVFEGVPPDHVDGGQLDGAGPCRHQGFPVFTAADQATFAVLVTEHRLIRVAAQAADIGAGQRWQLGAGQTFGLHRQAAGQRIADLSVIRLRVPAFAQGQASGRQPGGIGRISDGLGLDRQQQFGRGDAHQLAGFGPLGGVLYRLWVDQRGVENLRRNDQFATVLRVDCITHFDHAVALAIDVFFVGA
ncbi:hypothetical protein D3C87_988210 [compost metagenome]